MAMPPGVQHWLGMAGWHKVEIMRLLGWCGVVASCEVTRLFVHLVTQEELVRETGNEVRQVTVPDFWLELPAATATGLTTPGLHLAHGHLNADR